MCFIPPQVLEHCGSSGDAEAEQAARDSLALTLLCQKKMTYQGLRCMFLKSANTDTEKNRQVYSMDGSTQGLPGRFIMSDASGSTQDPDLQATFDNAGIVYDFLKGVLDITSLDDHGMDMISSGHFGRKYNNAFWNGEQMVYGDGDGKAFRSLHDALDVAGHEMTHGLIDHSCRLIYKGQSGALNESLADVYGATIEQWHKKQSWGQASWLIGASVIGPGSTAKALRSFRAERAYLQDPLLGTDIQPKHMSGYVRTVEDNGGVHINSGIPNHAYYLVCQALGESWERPIHIWDWARRRLWFWMGFRDLASRTRKAARILYGPREEQAVREAWHQVGIDV